MNMFRIVPKASVTPFPRKDETNVLEQKSSAASEFIRGGRVGKTSKGRVSFAPSLAGASALALGALLAAGSPVEAGNCTETGTTGMWLCTGAAGSDDKQGIVGRANQNISVTGDATFGLRVGNEAGIDIDSDPLTGTIDVNLSDSKDVISFYEAIKVDQSGAGAVTITTNGTISSLGGYTAIYVDQDGAGGVTVTTNGAVSGYDGIFIRTETVTTGEVRVTANNSVTSGHRAIDIEHKGSGGVAVVTTGAITSNGSQEAIGIVHSGTGDVSVNASNIVTASRAGTDAINVLHSGTGNIAVTVSGEVVGGSGASAVELSTASGDAVITLGTGASFQGGVDTSGVAGTVSIEVAGNVNGFNFGSFGSGADSFTINEGRTLSISGVQSWNGPVTLSGRLELAGNNTGITVASLTGGGDGHMDIDVDFSGGDAELDRARLTAMSVAGTIPVHIKSVNEFRIPAGDEDGSVTLENFLDVADSDAFRAGNVLDNGNFDFDLVYDSVSNRWNLVACPIDAGCRPEEAGIGERRSIEEALYESLPAALAQLVVPESHRQRLKSRQRPEGRQRLQGRQHRGVWAKVSNASAAFEPAGTTLATYEIENTVAEFGFDTPVRVNACIPGSCTVSASVAFGDAAADVVLGGDTGGIETGSVKAVLAANWEHGGAYVDGQLQYAVFSNEIKTDVKLVDKSATAYSAGAEFGYGADVAGFRLVPSVQLLWTSVDFGTFTDFAGTRVKLDDGFVLAGRTGVEAEYDRGGVLLRGHADVFVPVDGEVGTRVGGMKLISEHGDPFVDAGIGATYAWGRAYALSANISARQGGEVEGYAGSVGIKYKF